MIFCNWIFFKLLNMQSDAFNDFKDCFKNSVSQISRNSFAKGKRVRNSYCEWIRYLHAVQCTRSLVRCNRTIILLQQRIICTRTVHSFSCNFHFMRAFRKYLNTPSEQMKRVTIWFGCLKNQIESHLAHAQLILIYEGKFFVLLWNNASSMFSFVV